MAAKTTRGFPSHEHEDTPKASLSDISSGSRTLAFVHSKLGRLEGLHFLPTVAQFRAIPFATVPGRFRQSVLLTDLSSTDRKFTQTGYACPQQDESDAPGGGPLSGDVRPILMDEHKCLIVQVSAPTEALSNTAPGAPKLPVLVYIHGGGFHSGKTDQQHSTFAFRYRLGALGFLTSADLSADAASHNEPPGNFALFDQRNGLLWVQRFISGFGGDPGNVTVMGESAGSVSIHTHMISTTPSLFKRAALMSGSLSPMLSAAPFDHHEKTYQTLLATLSISSTDPNRLAKLRAVPAAELVTASTELRDSGTAWLPLAHESFFPVLPTWRNISELTTRCDWVESIMIGTTGFEGYMFLPLASAITPSSLSALLTRQFGPLNAAKLLAAYDITPDIDANLFITRAMEFVGELIFDVPTHHLARHLPHHRTHRYVFDVPNPFPGTAFHGTAHHWVDMYSVFATFLARLPTTRLRNISTHHARLWTAFANGEEPWTAYVSRERGGEEVVMVASGEAGWVERTRGADEEVAGRRYARWEAVRGVWEAGWGSGWVEPLGGLVGGGSGEGRVY
ncbi:alpha/beta-hydrolase [Mytilinidion resinicola]|uniref:Carboxylic ester hydrolase n=1 Tax=Mytilinidion resinicola TaxID=574789 RepID=A0A6A6YSP3_9PEZI|nr:alpha/beta-hydrolase [Mytilinidion resinicola]KAF2811791.1 alpha/beta-hydrolase [Mytilinidion resinicola]